MILRKSSDLWRNSRYVAAWHPHHSHTLQHKLVGYHQRKPVLQAFQAFVFYKQDGAVGQFCSRGFYHTVQYEAADETPVCHVVNRTLSSNPEETNCARALLPSSNESHLQRINQHHQEVFDQWGEPLRNVSCCPASPSSPLQTRGRSTKAFSGSMASNQVGSGQSIPFCDKNEDSWRPPTTVGIGVVSSDGSVNPVAAFGVCLFQQIFQVEAAVACNQAECKLLLTRTIHHGNENITLSPLQEGVKKIFHAITEDGSSGASSTVASVSTHNSPAQTSTQHVVALAHACKKADSRSSNCPCAELALTFGENTTGGSAPPPNTSNGVDSEGMSRPLVFQGMENLTGFQSRSLKLGVSVLVENPYTRNLLLTRRCSHMRSFPGAWVFPGGAVDPGETIETAAVRETYEETGVVVDETSLTPIALWESCYPTTAEECIKQRTGVKAHYLVVFFTGRIRHQTASSRSRCDIAERDTKTDNSYIPVRLQATEADRAVWLDSTHVEAILGDGPTKDSNSSSALPKNNDSTVDYPPILLGVDGAPIENSEESNDIQRLAGIYPNSAGEGIAQGHIFALRQLREIWRTTA